MRKVSYTEFHKWAKKRNWLLLAESAQGAGIMHYTYAIPSGPRVCVEVYIGLVKHYWIGGKYE